MPKHLSALYLTPHYTEEEEVALHRGILDVVQLRLPSCTSDAILEMNMQSAPSIAQKAVTPNKLKRARQACDHLPNQENTLHVLHHGIHRCYKPPSLWYHQEVRELHENGSKGF
jgi:hypothetical protein